MLPQRCTPRLVEQIARLGASSVSFGEARELLAALLGVELTTESVRRITEGAGKQALALERGAAAALEKSLPPPPATLVDRLQQVSVDGAMVPLVGGKWEEVKCVVIGRVQQTDAGPKAGDLSYFARLADADRFIAEARTEMHRRGTENAREVVAISDGAEWIQRYWDEHCPGARRIIDWTHAAGYVRAAGQALFAASTADCTAWTRAQLDLLWEGKAETVVAELTALQDDSERLKPVREARHYLDKRLEMVRYADFRAAGYPVGSGIVESANKVLVEARLKGAGKHWARDNVDPLLTLRCSAANKRWPGDWPKVQSAMRHRHRPLPAPTPPPPPPCPLPPTPVAGLHHVPTIVNGKPTAAHAWKRYPACRAKT